MKERKNKSLIYRIIYDLKSAYVPANNKIMICF